MRRLLLVAALLPLPALAQAPLTQEVAAILGEAPAGTRFGLLVETQAGEEIVAVSPDNRFVPASNTKLFTTLGAYPVLAELQAAARGTAVRLVPAGDGMVDVVLVGHGDPALSSAPGCTVQCLTTLADAVAGEMDGATRRVRHVVGDDSWYPDERWPSGMSWNNIPSRSGTATSALTLDDNEALLTITPGAAGEAATVEGSGYYTIDNRVRTVPGSAEAVAFERLPFDRVLRLSGTIGAESGPVTLRGGIDDPAHHAAWHLARLLRQRGVAIAGEVQARHLPAEAADAQAPEEASLLELPASPVTEDVVVINKVSQNLHAELLLRRLGRLAASGSVADGQAALHATLDEPAKGAGWYLADGSGMSNYNRVTPRAVVALLHWAGAQPWGEAWRASLPVAGQDGTLRSRFAATPLAGRLWAKTGSLNAARALSGTMQAASGRVLVFSAFANDMPPGGDAAATAVLDRALLAIAAAN
ncbi:D-alanyl-D-alanine carboxypeptidase/D-alanyl-D-alanine-endopeptidase [Croceibacterium sp. TMG7-5b_MA50]|uniref:D-alanyl-D-alanine carboxypeptidase/D-alanyl-D-alanine endopeptidase n=1 Tax=Croceibacterium sp. TMG7-5b_MA50 TaxID=3121290 RepID=UPI00322218E9